VLPKRKIAIAARGVGSAGVTLEAKENFYFTCKYRLCDGCKCDSKSNSSEPSFSFSLGCIPFVRNILKYSTHFLPRLLRPSRPYSQKRDELVSIFYQLNDDCCGHILTYLSVEDLNRLSQVSKVWYQRTSAEINLFSRFIEAWNHSTTIGVYVNLDNICSVLSVTPVKNDQAENRNHDDGDILTGGYLRLLPTREFRLSDPSQPSFFYVNMKQPRAETCSVRWQYVKPQKHATKQRRNSKSDGNGTPNHLHPFGDTNENVNDSSITSTILHCLPERHKRLLAYMRQKYEVTVEGSPVFSRGSILFPYIVSLPYVHSSFPNNSCSPVNTLNSNNFGTHNQISSFLGSSFSNDVFSGEKIEPNLFSCHLETSSPVGASALRMSECQHYSFHVCFLFSC
jgi:hypothetical protein